jgi:hypothetical protein
VWKLLAAVGLFSPGIASGGEFVFTDFADVKSLFLMRDAHRSGKTLRLTDASTFEAGAAWYKEKQPVAGGFDTTFTFRLSAQDPRRLGGADGLAFVVQNQGPKVIGGLGASGGFMRSDKGAPGPYIDGIVRRVAVFFDTFANKWDASDNHVAICTNGPDRTLVWPPRCQALSQRLSVELKNGRPHIARILYEPPRLSIFLDELPEPVRTASIDLASLVGGDGTAWVGFTASTGDSFENHDIVDWRFHGRPRGGAESTMTTVDSSMSSVDSSISFDLVPCLPNRTLCTPEQAVIQTKAPGLYHVYLPANLEWGASVPNPGGASARVFNVTGKVCWDPRLREGAGCNGPPGNGIVPGIDAEGGADFVAPKMPAGSLVVRTLNGKLWFTVNDRTGPGFKDNEGFFEFDVALTSHE